MTPWFIRQPSYPAQLQQAWADATAPRAPDAPTVISTFAGRGGSSTGYHMAGYHELLAVEWDGHAADTLRLNYPALDVYHGDIAHLSVAEVLRRTGLQPGELDLLEGSPPCQGFSLSGQRQLDDPRNQLFREFVRLIDGLHPRVFLMENVRGMVAGQMIRIYQEALDALRGAGPGYRTVSGLINARHLGVPQSRTRLIVIGVREDLGIQPTLPAPQTGLITVRQALHGLPDEQDGMKLHDKWLPVWARTGQGRSFKDLHPRGHMFSHTKIHPDKPAPTILKTVGVQRDGRANNGLYHWRWPRLMTIPELKRLGSFPDPYRFATTGDPIDDFVNAWNGIGNSVPPLMTRAIAQHIRQTILTPGAR
ncbi:DNA cytosine methyltransferase (plasmid) [Deinococcus aquaticus]|uniref:Cytosine-specific methyltransferase n=1 Tax=Deinococcus aquaticus TaxID=328692 RepID=A0ABY7V728_9DEIO|nr:DNA cytosine methyltransferase [Deinococcus aquaticus]WDA60651.1 DNA cytosine methyltransferase [Deinococcus aquaticus]